MLNYQNIKNTDVTFQRTSIQIYIIYLRSICTQTFTPVVPVLHQSRLAHRKLQFSRNSHIVSRHTRKKKKVSTKAEHFFEDLLPKFHNLTLRDIVTTEVRTVTLIQLAAGNQKAQNGIVFSVMKFVTQLIDIYRPA